MPTSENLAKTEERRRALLCYRRVETVFYSFCEYTNLHGFQYIVRKNNKYKRIFWGILCIASACLCIFLLHTQIEQYRSKRILTSIETTAYPIWNIPFPAVTICNHNLVYKDNAKPFVDLLKFHGINEETIDSFFSDLSNLIIREEVTIKDDFSTYKAAIDVLETYGYNTKKLMRKLAHPCSKILLKCLWRGTEYNCSEIFRTVITTYGFCCSFNYGQHYEETSNLLEEDELQSTSGVGPFYGLQLSLAVEEDQYTSPIKRTYGMNVLVHEPNVYPVMGVSGNILLAGLDLSINLRPQVIHSNEIRHLSIDERRCLFRDEGWSSWSNGYSFYNCIYEVYSMNAISFCHCLPYYLPFKTKLRYCTLLDSSCLQKYKYNFSGISYESKGTEESEVRNLNCYPQCDLTFYEPYVDKQFYVTYNMISNEPSNGTSVRVYYRSIDCTRITRTVSMTWDTLMALLGGLFGMCLGGSLLSVVEIFFTIVNAFLESNVKSDERNEELSIDDREQSRSLKWRKQEKTRKRRNMFDDRYLSALKEIETNWKINKTIKLYDA